MQPTFEDQIGVAYELGAVNATIKFAHELPPAQRDMLLSRISPQHQDLVRSYQAVVSGKN